MKTSLAPGRVSRALSWLLALLCSPAAFAAAPAAMPADIARCLALRESASMDAMELAQELLARADLAVSDQVLALGCLGGAKASMADPEGAAVAATVAATLLDDRRIAPTQQMHGSMVISETFLNIGDDRRALISAQKAYRLAQDLGDAKMQEIVLVTLSRLHADYLNDLDQSVELLRQAMALALANDNENPHLYYFYGMNLVRAGRHEEAMPALDRALELMGSDRTAAQFEMPTLRVNTHRAEVLQSRGHIDQARALLDHSISRQRTLHDAIGLAVSLTKLGRLQLSQGELEPALANASEAVALAEQGKFRLEIQHALTLLADVQAARGDAASALQTARRSHALEAHSLKNQNTKALAGMQAQMTQDADKLDLAHAKRLRTLALGALGVTLVFGAGVAVTQHFRYRRLRITSMTDPLTGLLNRRGAMRRFDAGELDAVQGGEDDTRNLLMLMDVDHFKIVNDRFGHRTGDDVLRIVAKRLRSLCSSNDIVARWGGEEFLIACTDITAPQAQALAERVRAGVAANPVVLQSGEELTITVSLGFAPYGFFPSDVQERWQDSLDLADHALYCAKHSGRNAWLGLWGVAAGSGTPLHIVRQFTERAQTKGWIKVLGSRTHDVAHASTQQSHEFLARA